MVLLKKARPVEGWYERHITAALANNQLRGFGLVGNLAADKMREEKKRKEAMAAKDKKPTTAMLSFFKTS
jgi:hypothetical protein